MDPMSARLPLSLSLVLSSFCLFFVLASNGYPTIKIGCIGFAGEGLALCGGSWLLAGEAHVGRWCRLFCHTRFVWGVGQILIQAESAF